MKTVAIVGAGFCGTTLAARLLHAPPVASMQVVLIDRCAPLARGVAYGAQASRHVLNVPARRMSAWPEDDGHFYHYARRRDPSVTPDSFLPRALYGDYLETVLDDAMQRSPAGCTLRSVVADVERIEPRVGGEGARLALRGGATIEADRVVLCIGNHPPMHPFIEPVRGGLHAHPRYVGDPWARDALGRIKAGEPVLLIGTGLTMLDVVLDLRERGHRAPIHAVSRRGLTPLPHGEPDAQPGYDGAHLTEAMLASPSARRYLSAVLRAVDGHAGAGGDWRDVIGGLRGATPALWHALPLDERRRFMRHLRPYWDVHRHRCAPRVHERLRDELAGGAVRIVAGKVRGHADTHDGLQVSIGARGGRDMLSLEVGAVVNCTGPAASADALGTPLLASLRDDGRVSCDALALGFDVNDDYALLDRRGVASSWLYYVGPFLRAQFWEATAVPELRVHVERLARALRRSLAEVDALAAST